MKPGMNGFKDVGTLGYDYIYIFRLDFGNEMKTSFIRLFNFYLAPVVAGMLVIGYSIWNDLRKVKAYFCTDFVIFFYPG